MVYFDWDSGLFEVRQRLIVNGRIAGGQSN
jgi:hypothetical protein